MQNRDKIIREVALTLGIPQIKVREVVSSQAELARKAMQNKEATSVYLRQVGTFISKPVQERLKQERRDRKLAPEKMEEESEESVYYFKQQKDE